MSDESITGDTGRAPAPATGANPSPASKDSLRFVALFIVYALVPLLAYQYALSTAAMDWYLSLIARQTAWALNVIGHSGQVVNVAANSPLSLEGKGAGPSTTNRYPLVVFVYDPGSLGRMAAAQQRLAELDALPATPENTDAIRASEAEIAELNAAAGQKDPIEFRFRVASECSAIPSMIIYLAAVLAFPTGRRNRWVGLAGGLPVLYVVNILRLVCLGVIGAFTEGGPWFKISHQYIWQGIYVVFVVAVWMAWIEYVVRRRDP